MRRFKFQFRGVGAYPWLLARTPPRGIYNRLAADDRFASKQILSEVQWCLNTLPSYSGYSAYQLVFGSNPANLFGRGDADEDLLFTQDTSLSGQLVQR